MIRIFQFAILLLLLSCNHPEGNKNNRRQQTYTFQSFLDDENGYRVIGIKDGDTFVMLITGREQTVRLAHIDCPEKRQPFGTRAKQFASDLCFGKYVTLVHNNKYDRNKRLIAEVILQDGTNLNKELVKNGLAWHFKKYSTNNEYAQLEIEARNKNIGIWSDSNPIAPWSWRKK